MLFSNLPLSLLSPSTYASLNKVQKRFSARSLFSAFRQKKRGEVQFPTGAAMHGANVLLGTSLSCQLPVITEAVSCRPSSP